MGRRRFCTSIGNASSSGVSKSCNHTSWLQGGNAYAGYHKLCSKKWELDHLEVIYEHSTRGVFSAESKDFGPVILKVNQHKSQLESEYRMLAQLAGSHSCKVYAFDEIAGLLLEERIFPGTVLRREASLEKRIQMFLQVFREIHMPADSGPTYLSWLENICEYCAQHHVAENMASQAHSFCAEMFEKYPDRVLLHGDLHHDNLLLRTDGTYAMIDPKGVIGPAIMDLPRFNITKLFYMETVLENIWCMEDGEEMNRREIELAEALNYRELIR